VIEMKHKMHIFGASGSGTTTIAKAICDKLGYKHFDSDDYYWLPTKDPFTAERLREECLKMLESDLTSCDNWVLSGSLTGWGEIFTPLFDLVVFVYVPQDIRLKRLKKREYERYGDEILPGSKKYEDSKTFLEWAACYDAGTRNGRSFHKHEQWLSGLECKTIKVINLSLEDSINTVIRAVKGNLIQVD